MTILAKSETWRDVQGYPLYEVSNYGAIRRKDDGRILQPYRHKDSGFMEMCLKGEDGKNHSNGLGKLVATAFIPKHEGDQAKVQYLDGNPSNCRVSNLQWYNSCRDDAPATFNSPLAVVCVETGEIWDSQSAAARDMGIKSSSICLATHNPDRTSAGFHWVMYEDWKKEHGEETDD